MKLGKNALTVLEKRYLIRDGEGNPTEGAEELFRRVAKAVAAADAVYDPTADIAGLSERFYRMMTDLEFLPNSPTLMNAGRELGQLSACFVLPVGDSMEEIFDAVKQAALIHKSGGGTGFSFSRLRPKGSAVKTTGGVASGPISFMKVFNMATEAVKQGGTRRGANMGILRVDHPDILEFIDCKKDNHEINNFNISVGVTEAFMAAAEAGGEYQLIDPRTGDPVKKLPAREVYDKIVDAAWRNGEPGIIFLDRLNRDNPVPSQGEIESTNPCGEQPLLPYESCNLGSVNLAMMLRQGRSGPEPDYEKLGAVVRDAIHFLDNVIDINRYPLEVIDQTTKATRKIGLGVMGYADLLLRMGLPYGSEGAVKLAEELMGFITETARSASQELAKTRGAFPLFSESVYKDGPALRNATVTTIAPTGTLSIIAGCSSGVEPVFAYAYIRNVMDGTEMLEVSPVLEEALKSRGIFSHELMRKIAAEGTLAHIPEIPEDIRKVFVCAHDIHPEDHIRTQAAFQRRTDNAVSKTVNFQNSATREDVSRVYQLAWKEGCKGVTIYRDGSRYGQVLNVGKVKKEGEEPEKESDLQDLPTLPFGEIVPRPRPAVTYGSTEKMKIGCGSLYVTVNYDENGICEVFTSTGKGGGCPSQSEATARLVSIALRSGVKAEALLEQLQGIRCPSTVRQAGMKCTSCPDAIAKVVRRVDKMRRAIPGGMGTVAAAESTAEPRFPKFCPECGTRLEHEGGCVACRSCGYSKCS